jgi:hypothetical protein
MLLKDNASAHPEPGSVIKRKIGREEQNDSLTTTLVYEQKGT